MGEGEEERVDGGLVWERGQDFEGVAGWTPEFEKPDQPLLAKPPPQSLPDTPPILRPPTSLDHLHPQNPPPLQTIHNHPPFKPLQKAPQNNRPQFNLVECEADIVEEEGQVEGVGAGEIGQEVGEQEGLGGGWQRAGEEEGAGFEVGCDLSEGILCRLRGELGFGLSLIVSLFVTL